MMWTTNENFVVKLFLGFWVLPKLFFGQFRRSWINSSSWTCWNQMKMLEICLKLVGCKSKKGLSSSSSCYFEGKRLCRSARGCVQMDGSEVFWWKWQARTLGSSVCLESGGGEERERRQTYWLTVKEREEKRREGRMLGNLIPACVCTHLDVSFIYWMRSELVFCMFVCIPCRFHSTFTLPHFWRCVVRLMNVISISSW